MIDISDGRALDLGHIMEESNVGAVLYEENIPLVKGANINNALYDGEDFELLFTVRIGDGALFRRNRAPSPILIGEMVDKKQGLKMKLRDGSLKKIDIKGYTHF
jgi:thiamine-monophosphate kinase